MKEKFNLRMMTFSALLVAFTFVIDRAIPPTPTLKIGFSFIPVIVAAVLYGPLVAGIVYGLADFIGALLIPYGAYHPGFTVCCVIMGIVYGLFLYRANIEGHRIKFFLTRALPPTVINALIGLFINTIWISQFAGGQIIFSMPKAEIYMGNLIHRITQYAVMIPLNLILIPVLVQLSERLLKIAKKKESK